MHLAALIIGQLDTHRSSLDRSLSATCPGRLPGPGARIPQIALKTTPQPCLNQNVEKSDIAEASKAMYFTINVVLQISPGDDMRKRIANASSKLP